jgi:hypothetical protein
MVLKDINVVAYFFKKVYDGKSTEKNFAFSKALPRDASRFHQFPYISGGGY